MNDAFNIPRRRARSGFALHIALMLILSVSAVCGLFLYAAGNHARRARRWQAHDQCLLDAQSALEQVKYELYQAYLSNQAAGGRAGDWFQTWDAAGIGSNPAYRIPALPAINGSAVRVFIAGVAVMTNAGHAEISLAGTAAKAAPYAMTRSIQEILRIPIAGPGRNIPPLDYAYQLGLPGQVKNNMIINGDLRVNGNLRLNNAATVNGNRYASGPITANSPLWTVQSYWQPANTSPRARPTDPAGPDGPAWPMGYAPDKTKNSYLPEAAMPAIDAIETLAATAAGRVTQNNTILADNVYDGAGPDGLRGTADDRCLVLDGSTAPINIEGTVVVQGDVIIRGQITGQGVIYSGRNIHITGDLVYRNPPAWPKPDADPEQTARANAAQDLLILGAQGNVVVGNYTAAAWSNKVWNILTDSANIAPYAVSASDAAVGYDSDNNPANGYQFDGRLYVNEPNGGRRLSVGTNTVPRKFYESSLADQHFNSLCDPDISIVDAAIFCNHAVIGRWGDGTSGGAPVLNGALACRSDFTAFDGRFTMNWDIRLGSQSREHGLITLWGPGGAATGAVAITIGWKEIN